MRLFRTVLALGVGYALGHPAGRRQLNVVAERIGERSQRLDVVDLGDRRWARSATTLRLSRASKGTAGTWSGGLRWARGRRFPRQAASSRPDVLIPPPPYPRPPTYAAPTYAAATTPKAADPPVSSPERPGDRPVDTEITLQVPNSSMFGHDPVEKL